jgi:hypothetical protein
MPASTFSVNKKFHLLQSRTRIWESKDQLEHYRIVFIQAGEGHFLLGTSIYNYQPGGLMFLCPGEHPVFQEDDETEILLIAFDTYLSSDFQRKKALHPDFADTYKQVENLCNNLKYSQGKPLANERDAAATGYLFGQIAFEMMQLPAPHFKLIMNSIEMLVTILARNNFENRSGKANSNQQLLTEHLIEYLRNELHQNKTIRIPEVLMRFNISEEAANLCMMNRAGMSLRNFIMKYKADLFKSRMLKMDIVELSPYLRPQTT